MGEYAELQVADSRSDKILSPFQQQQYVLQPHYHEEDGHMQVPNQPLIKKENQVQHKRLKKI